MACQFDELRKFKSVALVRKALQDLPAGLDKTYDRMLQSLDPDFKEQVVSMLKWLCFCDRLLTVEELAEIFILPSRGPIVLEKLKTERLFDSRDVLKYLGSFVVAARLRGYSSGGVVVRLPHFSIKEYLTSLRALEGPAAAFSFSEPDARFYIALSCLRYLAFVASTENRRRSRHPLSYRASREWMRHLESFAWKSWPVKVVEAVKRVRTPKRDLGRLCISRLLLGRYQAPGMEEFCFRKEAVGLPPFCATSAFGLRETTDMLLSTNEYFIQEDLDAALLGASLHRHMRLVKFLLDRGADVNGEAATFGDALHAAAIGNHEDVVGLLLDEGADINSEHGGVGSPLQVAVLNDAYGVVKLLVSRGAEMCNENGCAVASAAMWFNLGILHFLLGHCAGNDSHCIHSTAMHKAIADRDVDPRPGVLVERGAEVNAWGGKELSYPLHWACRYRALDEVKLLVSMGADVHALSGSHGSALQAACVNKESAGEITQFLLEQGVDVNAQGGEYGNALQAACYIGGPDGDSSHAVPILLDNGADVNASGGLFDNAMQAAVAAAPRTKEPDTVLLKVLLSQGADVNKQGGKYGTALQAAATSSQHGRVKFLLDHGADVNAQGGEYGTSFQAACVPVKSYRKRTDEDDDQDDIDVESIIVEYTRKEETQRILLDHGADVHLQGGFFGSAWHAAAAAKTSCPEWEELMQLLLDRGVDVNDTRGREEAPTALHALFQPDDHRRFQDNLNFLLTRGADPNLSADVYGYPLQAACAVSWVQASPRGSAFRVNFLLEQCPNVDVNAAGGLFGSALQAAASSGQTDSVALLLARGADVNLGGGKYGSALNAAIVKGYWDAVELLLQAGAEPDCRRLQEPDEEWLQRAREEEGRGAVERYKKFWEAQVKKKIGS